MNLMAVLLWDGSAHPSHQSTWAHQSLSLLYILHRLIHFRGTPGKLPLYPRAVSSCEHSFRERGRGRYTLLHVSCITAAYSVCVFMLFPHCSVPGRKADHKPPKQYRMVSGSSCETLLTTKGVFMQPPAHYQLTAPTPCFVISPNRWVLVSSPPASPLSSATQPSGCQTRTLAWFSSTCLTKLFAALLPGTVDCCCV